MASGINASGLALVLIRPKDFRTARGSHRLRRGRAGRIRIKNGRRLVLLAA